MGRRKMFGPALPPAMKKARAAARKRAPKTKTEQVALIKSVIAREEETKYRSQLLVNSVAYNSQVATTDIIPLLPKLVQGQGDSAIFEREGMRVTPRKLKIDCEVCLTDTTVPLVSVDRGRSVVVCYWVLQHKNVKSIPLLASNVIIGSDFLKTGDSSNTQGFNGYVEDATLPVNDAKYTVLKKGTFKLGKNPGQLQDSTTVGEQPLGGQAINKRLSFTLKTPKNFVYEQDESSPRTVFYPSGYAPFMVFGYYHQNQTVPDETFKDITVSLRSHLWFDDA